MKIVGFLLLLIVLGFAGCKDETNDIGCEPCNQVERLSQSDGQVYLQAKYLQIQKLVDNTPCTDTSQWEVIPIGAKGCGGPWGFIAYNKHINGAEFLKMVEDYTNAQIAFNKKWGVVSDCTIAIKPSKVECVDGKSKLKLIQYLL